MADTLIQELMSSKIDTPCIDVCSIDPKTNLCSGCLRSLDEIAAWGGLPPSERRRIMAALPGRSRLNGKP
jgi:predicted Fe-S protein YdhL (DUF1289 family)